MSTRSTTARHAYGLDAGDKVQTHTLITSLGLDTTRHSTACRNENSMTTRKPLQPVEIANGIAKLMNARPTWTIKDVSKALGISPSYVRRLIKRFNVHGDQT